MVNLKIMIEINLYKNERSVYGKQLKKQDLR